MTTRRRFLKMLGIAPVAAAVTTAIVKEQLRANPGTEVTDVLEDPVFNTFEKPPFVIQNGHVYIDQNVIRVTDNNGVVRVKMGKW